MSQNVELLLAEETLRTICKEILQNENLVSLKGFVDFPRRLLLFSRQYHSPHNGSPRVAYPVKIQVTFFKNTSPKIRVMTSRIVIRMPDHHD